jgi:hypothetical protein
MYDNSSVYCKNTQKNTNRKPTSSKNKIYDYNIQQIKIPYVHNIT